MARATLEDALRVLEAVRECGDGYVARCPCHDDKRPSLSIKEAADGTLLVKCFAGCDGAEILRWLNEHAAVETGDGERRRRRRPGRVVREIPYHHCDEQGRVIAIHMRREFDSGGKSFAWLGSDGKYRGDREIRVNKVPLYATERVVKTDAKTVVVVEGQKCADALWKVGIPAVGVPGAEVRPVAERLHFLRGRTVILWPDKDDPGRKCMKNLAQRLRDVGVTDLRWLEPPEDAPEGWDAADAVEQWGADAVRQFLKKACPWPEAPVVWLSEIEPENISWLWPNWVPRKRVTVVAGEPGVGKSFFVAALAAAVSAGGVFPDGAKAPEGRVLLCSFEDDASDTVRPRIEAMGGRVDRIALPLKDFELPDGADMLHRMVDHTRADLAIIDTLVHVESPKLDAHSQRGQRAIMKPLAAIARETGAAIVVVSHFRKASAEFAHHRVGGSRDIVAAARAVIAVVHDPEQDVRAVGVIKSNLAKPPGPVGFDIDGNRVLWLGQVDVDVEALTLGRKAMRETKVDAAEAAIMARLATGPATRAELIEAVVATGVSERSAARALSALKSRGLVAAKREHRTATYRLLAADGGAQ